MFTRAVRASVASLQSQAHALRIRGPFDTPFVHCVFAEKTHSLMPEQIECYEQHQIL